MKGADLSVLNGIISRRRKASSTAVETPANKLALL